MIILEVLTSESPFPNKTDASLYGHVVINQNRPVRPMVIIPERSIFGNILWGILTSCWSYDPQLRPDSATVWQLLKPLTQDQLKEVEEFMEVVESDADEMRDE
ncbi:hypothetical protein RSOLAG1IB_11495 [Rhizoctonia solani AG-1 IB]|uniref:Pkinase domain-containing protein n=1 Tax=Thanatephorus cucumeris (strain AG1-IB / isolate 7/3/14) TaxID=1108050 RepID=A0A0B7FC00_THACB|nr:hypothetical protein RSOLAG1IB_11495 [Rhizoctonia solani AG-1 IB]